VNYFALSLLALTSFGLTLADGSDMGFVFVILALRQLPWTDAMLMGGAALFIQSVVRREHSSPQVLLRRLTSTGLAVMLSQAVFHATQLSNLDTSARFMVASVFCFLGYNFRGLNKLNLWPFPYYPVAAAIAALFPVSVVLVPAVFITWRSYRIYARRLEQRCAESKRMMDLHMRTIETLAMAIEAKEQPMSGRTRRVQIYSMELGKALQLENPELDALRSASLLYDIGEMAVPEHIMRKPGALTAEEFEKVKIHPLVGADILERVRFPYPVAPLVRAHHERWDGAGYPRGLAGAQIPIGARIIAAVDTLDALTSPRQHRPAARLDDAVQFLVEESGRAFDPAVVSLIAKNYKQWESQFATHHGGDFVDSIFAAQREAQTLLELTNALNGSIDLDETFVAIRKALRQLVPFQTMIVWTERLPEHPAEPSVLEPSFLDGDHLAIWSSARIPMGAGISGLAAASGVQQSGLNPNLELAYLGALRAVNPFRHAFAAPLHSGEVRGAMTLYRAGDLPFSMDDARLMAGIAPKLAAAIANGLRFRKINQVDLSDPLTSLPNAKALELRMKKLEPPTAVVVCDLDGFKQVNDRYGHLTGNRLLQDLAKGFERACRGADFVARTGGDEFVLLLPGLRRHETSARLEQFREMVRMTGRLICGDDVVDASFGAAFYPMDPGTPEELLAKADSQMYRRKSEQKAGVLRMGRSASA
jgi:diguanylate cyclase (GGDEF)-like protein